MVSPSIPDNFPELGLACLRCGVVVPPMDGACEDCALELADAIRCVDAAARSARQEVHAAQLGLAAYSLRKAADELEASERER